MAHPPTQHVVFDGRLLHGAPPELSAPAPAPHDDAGGVRVTFLVNVWLNHVPAGLRPFPAARLPLLRPALAPLDADPPAPEVLGLAAAAAIEPARAGPREPGAAAGAEVRAAFGPGGEEHVLVVRWPAAAPGDGPPGPGPCTVEAVFAPGDCPEVLAGEPE